MSGRVSGLRAAGGRINRHWRQPATSSPCRVSSVASGPRGGSSLLRIARQKDQPRSEAAPSSMPASAATAAGRPRVFFSSRPQYVAGLAIAAIAPRCVRRFRKSWRCEPASDSAHVEARDQAKSANCRVLRVLMEPGGRSVHEAASSLTAAQVRCLRNQRPLGETSGNSCVQEIRRTFRSAMSVEAERG